MECKTGKIHISEAIYPYFHDLMRHCFSIIYNLCPICHCYCYDFRQSYWPEGEQSYIRQVFSHCRHQVCYFSLRHFWCLTDFYQHQETFRWSFWSHRFNYQQQCHRLSDRQSRIVNIFFETFSSHKNTARDSKNYISKGSIIYLPTQKITKK